MKFGTIVDKCGGQGRSTENRVLETQARKLGSVAETIWGGGADAETIWLSLE